MFSINLYPQRIEDEVNHEHSEPTDEDILDIYHDFTEDLSYHSTLFNLSFLMTRFGNHLFLEQSLNPQNLIKISKKQQKRKHLKTEQTTKQDQRLIDREETDCKGQDDIDQQPHCAVGKTRCQLRKHPEELLRKWG
jgi:hypothetical protein